MAIEIDITGSGSFAGHKSNIASYSYAEGSTPVLPGDSSGGVGDVSFSVIDQADTILLYRNTLLLTDGGFGSIAGVVDSVSATDGVAEVTGRSKLGRLTVPGTIVAQQTTLGAAFTTILSLVGITTGIQVDSSLAARPIFLPGFTGDLWIFVKDLCIAENVEVSLLSDTVVLRPLRTRILNTGNLESESWSVSDRELAQQVEVAYYNYTTETNFMFYPKGGWTTEVQPYQVGAGETLVVDLPVDGFLTSIQQPTPQLSVARGYTGPNSVYSIAGNDGLPVPVAQWTDNGGLVTVGLKDNGATIEVTIVGANIANLAPFRLAVTAGPSDVYSTLRLVGSGIAFNRETIVRSTGLTVAETSNVDAPIIDNILVTSLTQAVDVAARAASQYGVPGRTYSASARQINRPNTENSNVVYPTFEQWVSSVGAVPAPTVTRTNLATNPSFETNTTGWIANQASANVLSTAQAFAGSQSWLLTAGGGIRFGVFGLRPSATGGLSYTLSGHVRDVTSNVQYRAELIWLAAGGAFLATIVGATTSVSSGGWTRLSVSGVAPVGAVSADVRILSVTAPAAGTQAHFDAFLFEQSATVGTYFDGNTLDANGFDFGWNGTANASTSFKINGLGLVTTRTNLITNPSFETNTTSWINGYNQNFVRSTAQAFSGSASIAMTSVAAGAMGMRTTTTGMPATPGTVYTLSAYTRPGSVARIVSVFVVFFDAAGVQIGTPNSTVFTQTLNSWVRTSSTRTAPALTAFVQIRLEPAGTAAGETHFWDAIMLEESAVLGTYFDGDSPDADGSIFDWNGAANASTSFDAVVAGATVARTNLITNPSLETNLVGWSATLAGSTGGITLAAGSAYLGSAVARLTLTTVVTGSNPPWLEPAQTVVVVGSTYVFSCWVRASSALTVNINMVSGGASENFGPQVTLVPNVWTRISGTRVANATTLNTRIRLVRNSTGTAGVTLDVDAALLEQTDILDEYFDGSTPDADGFDFGWTGTANASTSTVRTLLFSGFNVINAGVTFQEFTDTQFATVANDLTNQAFGNIGGSRTRYRDAMYRVRSATSTAESVSFDADPDTLFSDFTAVSSARTFTNMSVNFTGLTFTDFNLVPLRR